MLKSFASLSLDSLDQVAGGSSTATLCGVTVPSGNVAFAQSDISAAQMVKNFATADGAASKVCRVGPRTVVVSTPKDKLPGTAVFLRPGK